MTDGVVGDTESANLVTSQRCGGTSRRSRAQQRWRGRVSASDWALWGGALSLIRQLVRCGLSPELIEGILGPAVCDYVRNYRTGSATGAGPSWFQLGADLESVIYRVVPRPPRGVSDAVRLEWRRLVVQAVMPMLRATGWVEYDDNTTGSLRPGAVPQILLTTEPGEQGDREDVAS